jgi:tripartite motif-containing protein 9/67
MLYSGSDSKGWSMYIDNKRSWFMHSGVHTARTDGGITEGSVVGVLVDLDRRMVSFYLDGEHHGPIAFTEPEAGLNTGGVFYPAVSVNRNVQVTLHSGLSPPIDSDSDDT